jgi:hypothetical protein
MGDGGRVDQCLDHLMREEHGPVRLAPDDDAAVVPVLTLGAVVEADASPGAQVGRDGRAAGVVDEVDRRHIPVRLDIVRDLIGHGDLSFVDRRRRRGGLVL